MQNASGSGISKYAALPDRVSSTMSVSEIVDIMAKHRCPNLTAEIDVGQCTQVAVAGGGFGDVYRGALKGGAQVAIKCTRLYIQHDDAKGCKALKHIAQELYNWSRLKHENVLELFGLAEHQYQLAMISPWMGNGTLLDYLRRHPLIDRCPLLIQISEGLAYLHEHDMTHGDIKSGNVLISHDGTAKLADFGSAVLKRDTPSLHFTATKSSPAFTARWAAPEVLREKVPFSKESDVYSLGMTLLEAVTGCKPYDDITRDITVLTMVIDKRIPSKPIYFPSFNEAQAELLWDLFQRMWLPDPSERPGVKLIQNHLEDVRERALGGYRRVISSIMTYTKVLKLQYQSRQSASEIVQILVGPDSPNIASELNLAKCSSFPVSSSRIGDVFIGELKSETQVAIKCPRIYIQQDDTSGHRILRHAARELYHWSHLKHENILELLGLAEYQSRMAMVSPWMANGTLSGYIDRNPEVDRCSLLVQITRGVAYLHEYDMIHGDLRSANILVSDEGVAKIADFGCTFLKSNKELGFASSTGSPAISVRWMAPEILKSDKRETVHSKEADVYALGMTLLETVTGRLPFDDMAQDMAVLSAVYNGQTPARPEQFASLSDVQADLLWSILECAWIHQPSQRPSAKSVLDRITEIVGQQTRMPTEDHPKNETHGRSEDREARQEEQSQTQEDESGESEGRKLRREREHKQRVREWLGLKKQGEERGQSQEEQGSQPSGCSEADKEEIAAHTTAIKTIAAARQGRPSRRGEAKKTAIMALIRAISEILAGQEGTLDEMDEMEEELLYRDVIAKFSDEGK